MEVHHHPSVEKKSFKEYLLEGVMIFLAVTMGFIAENIREHIAEKKVEKEYIRSFVADLKADTAGFNAVIPDEETHIRGLDSLLFALTRYPYNDSTIRQMYYLFRKYNMSIHSMKYSLGTITQLKNAGGLRLISDERTADSIVAYNRMADDIIESLNYIKHEFMIPSINKGNTLFNSKYLLPYDAESIGTIQLSGEHIPLLSNDEKSIAEYTGLVYQVKEIRLDYLRNLKQHNDRAKDMLAFFQKEYHL